MDLNSSSVWTMNRHPKSCLLSHLALCWEPHFPAVHWSGRCSCSLLQVYPPIFQCVQLFYFYLLDSIETSKDLEPILCLYLLYSLIFIPSLIATIHHFFYYYMLPNLFPIFLTLYPDFPTWDQSHFLVPVPWLLTLLESIPKPHILVIKNK